MNNNYNGNNTGLGLDGVVNQPNPGFGLDGVVNQPNSGFGLPEEQVQSVEAVQPVQPMEPVQSVPTVELAVSNDVREGVPTEEEVKQYEAQRALASEIDGPVQYDYEKKISNDDLASKLLDSTKTETERQAYKAEQQMLDDQKEKIQSEIVLRNETAVQADKERIQMQYVNHPKQPIRVENRALDPVLVEKIKQTAKKAIAALATLGVTAGIVMGAHQALTQPEFVPNQTPQSIEFQEDLKNAKNINEANDITNEHKESQEGVIPHEAIEDLKTKEQQARQMQELVEQKTVEKEQKEEKMQELREKAVKNSNMSESMQNFVDEVNRQKVIKIESGKTIHPEQVVDSSDVVGGRGL